MKAQGKGWSTLIIILVVIVVLGLGIFRWYIGGYNNAVRMDEATKTAWANVDAVLQRRLDLVPNLVETVKGYATHEKELFENIAQARTKYFQADTRAKQIEASNELGGFLSRLLMLQERYPDLKANQNFLALQQELTTTENQISSARGNYNDMVMRCNNLYQMFPSNIVANMFGYGVEEFFEVKSSEERTAPKVSFK